MEPTALALTLCILFPPAQEDPAEKEAADVPAAIARGAAILLEMQEGEPKAEWPYEGVYREGGQIPPGYRVGGTSIAAWALIQTPGYGESDAAQEAVQRALTFVLATLDTGPMAAGFSRGYDVRGWGHAYALQFLLALRALESVPADQAEAVDQRIPWLVDVLQETEIESGGWNYARRARGGGSIPASPFMTAPTLMALYEARAQGEQVDDAVVERGLDTLEAGRVEGGWYTYTSAGGFGTVEGAIGRNTATEVALLLAGRGEVETVKRSLDWFLEHWEWLEKRRRQNGTHEPPHGIAPYYFFYAHFYAALGIEFLPEDERPKYRARFLELLFQVQEESGGWNDRVFPRSENFGTAMSLLALMQPDLPRPTAWRSAALKLKGGGR